MKIEECVWYELWLLVPYEINLWKYLKKSYTHLCHVKGVKVTGGRMELMNKELIFKIFVLCCALLVDTEACPCVTREFWFSCNAFLPTYGGELEIMCRTCSCTVVLCNIQTEISLKLFDRGVTQYGRLCMLALSVLLVLNIATTYFGNGLLCPPSGGENVRYLQWDHLVELLSYLEGVSHFTSCPPEVGKSPFQNRIVFHHQKIITFPQLATLFFLLLLLF